MTTTWKNWVDLLNIAQLCYNLHRISSIGMSPFELAMDWQPRTPLDVAKQRLGETTLQHIVYQFPYKRCSMRH